MIDSIDIFLIFLRKFVSTSIEYVEDSNRGFDNWTVWETELIEKNFMEQINKLKQKKNIEIGWKNAFANIWTSNGNLLYFSLNEKSEIVCYKQKQSNARYCVSGTKIGIDFGSVELGDKEEHHHAIKVVCKKIEEFLDAKGYLKIVKRQKTGTQSKWKERDINNNWIFRLFFKLGNIKHDIICVHKNFLIDSLGDISSDEVFVRDKIQSAGISKRILLYGPPGTGKTRAAKREWAPSIIWKSHRPEPWDQLQATEFNKFVKIIQFHPGYSYEDFVEGLRPISTPLGLRYVIVDGAFKALCIVSSSADRPLFARIPVIAKESIVAIKDICKIYWIDDLKKNKPVDALLKCLNGELTKVSIQSGLTINLPKNMKREDVIHEPDSNGFGYVELRLNEWGLKNYVLIIDEFSRGHVAKILGELMYALTEEPGEIAAGVLTQYSKTLLHIPAKLSIIGTMNTADRSVDDIDQAIRRRFDMVELLPNPILLGKTGNLSEYVCKILKAKFKFTKNDCHVNGVFGFSQLRSSWGKFDVPKMGNATVTPEKLLTEINNRLRDAFPNEPDKQIGHSYFFECLRGITESDVGNVGKVIATNFCRVLYHGIYPAIQSMCHGDLRKVAKIFGMDSSGVEKLLAEYWFVERDRIYPKLDLKEKIVENLKDVA